jgi:aminoglycoside phosphotransferase (APT) family kinase protein
MSQYPTPSWLPLLQKPYDNIFGPKSVWDLRMADGTAVRIERSSQGLNQTIYRVRIGDNVYACKLFVVDERRRAEREWTALRSLYQAGLKLGPEPVAYAPEGPLPLPAIVYRWVNGVPLSASLMGEDEVVQLVDTLQQLHRVRPAADITPLVAWRQPEGFRTYLAEIRAFVDRYREWAMGPGLRAELPTWAAGLPELLPMVEEVVHRSEAAVAGADGDGRWPVNALVRADGSLDNVVRDETGRLVFLDWEFSGWGDPAFDLAGLRWYPRNLAIPHKFWQTAFCAYVPCPEDVDFTARLELYNQLLPAWWVARSTVHLIEGVDQLASGRQAATMPARMYRAVRRQLDNYLAALGLIEPVSAEALNTGELSVSGSLPGDGPRRRVSRM